MQAELLKGAKDTMGSNVHSRILGNVLYLMTSQTTSLDTVRQLEQRMLHAEALGGNPAEEKKTEEELEAEGDRAAESSDLDSDLLGSKTP